MAKLDTVTLRVLDPDRQKQFYCDVLGMRELGAGRIGYGGEEAALVFEQAHEGYQATRGDLYWKIALSVPDIELACAQLAKAGVAVSEPHQFEDVGYLAHFADPEGFSIELIDHAFKGARGPVSSDAALLGGGAHLSLVTLRIADLEAVEPTLLRWGMRKLSVQPLTDYGFTLHFYAFTEEQPPEADLVAVANRTWTYQRPYTVLELQHVAALEAVRVPKQGEAGYVGVTIASDADAGFADLERLKIRWAG
ncbi:VOC family protein [Shimia sp. R9_3]|uniref:VOC family protein n=1 Tax=Shimia sp. R9_3 TaxID=2821113 RepID=UPI001AD9859E|nr:VOC family protein [Shimia sp. R9_3]MBO9400340.1 VOC family protein [Shimia sp. R9_3]